MNKTAVLVLAISSLMIMSGSLAFAQGVNTDNSSSAMIKLSAYSVGSYNSFGTLNNITYTSGETGIQTEIASSVYVNGSAMSVPSNSGNEKVSFVTVKNETLIGITEPKALIIATSPTIPNSGKATIKFDLTTVAKPFAFNLNVSSNATLGSLIQFNTFMKLSMKGYSAYQISNGSFTGYFVTNGQVNLSSNGMQITVNNNGSMMLIAGFISNGGVKNLLEKYFGENEKENRFSYNNTTGQVSGKFVNFNYSTSNQIIYNMSGTFSGQTVPVFTYVNASGNSVLISKASMSSIPLNKVITVGSVFFYANESFIYVVHDTPSMQSAFALRNGTLNLTLARGLSASIFSTTSAKVSYSAYAIADNEDTQNSILLGVGGHINAQSQAVIITGQNFTGFLMVPGNASITISNGMISISTKDVAVIHFVSPPGLRNIGKLNSDIRNAIETGKISDQIVINATSAGPSSNLTIGFNGTVNADVSSQSQGKATVSLSSTNHRGTTIAVFVTKEFLGTSNTVYLKFDGSVINITGASSIFNITSTTNAYYAVINESSGVMILIHVPHFSNHTIEISSTPYSTSTSTPTPTNVPLNVEYFSIAAGVGIIAIVGVAALVMRRKK